MQKLEFEPLLKLIQLIFDKEKASHSKISPKTRVYSNPPKHQYKKKFSRKI